MGKKGVYHIINTVNGKKYIGSTTDIEQRKKHHFTGLRSGNHRNPDLQKDYNAYGEQAFTIEIKEECDCTKEQLRKLEQEHIDKHNFNNLYNRSMYSTGGGADVQRIPVHVLHLDGTIAKSFAAVSHAADYIGLQNIVYSRLNTVSVFGGKYRIVTQDFYSSNRDIIASWPRYRSKRHRRLVEMAQKQANRYFCTLIDQESNETICQTYHEAGELLGVTGERARQLVRKGYERYKQYIIKDNIGSGKSINIGHGHKGLSYSHPMQKWTAFVDKGQKRVYLGAFTDKDTAIAFIEAANKALNNNEPIIAMRRGNLTTIA